MRDLSRPASYTAALILVLVPFHALLTTWAGSSFGHIDLFRIWKELLMVPLTITGLWLLSRNTAALIWLKKTRLLQLIALYVGLHLILGMLAWWRNDVTFEALIYALLINTRFVIFLLVAYAVATHDDWLKKWWPRLLLWPAAAVIGFGILQVTVLPPQFLEHFGYGETTIPAVHTIDQKLEYQRIQSTLRGPNPLGAYLVVIVALATWQLIKNKQQRLKIGLFGAGALAALYYTYSRSAWVGAAAAVAVVVWLSINSRSTKKWLLTTGAVVVICLAGLTFALRNNDLVQNVVFHTDENSAAISSSNADRSSSLRTGLNDLVREPWGRGPGTAGPASFRNDPQDARIAEDYYLQIGQEVGVLGLALFLGINLLVVYALYRRGGYLGIALVASWVGLFLINLLSHAWADDTLAYIWWGLAGIALAKPLSTSSDILNKKRKQPLKKKG